ncbi:uncharacterized protein LOC143590148 [Bidens hawaiensis]|uniref:uncharacterized protein LOC143590148 n=1 Tax=Bidens hawaiensis TaxID=980011 RepID=UPI0040499626
MISKFSSLGETLEENVLIRKLLDSAPEKYLQLVASIEQCSDVDSMFFEEAIERLKAYEDRLNQRKINVPGDNGLLFTQNESQQTQKGTGRVHEEKVNHMVMLNEETLVFHKHGDKKEMFGDTWYLDTGAINHMSGAKESFAELDDKVTGQVYYIHVLRSNIISLGQMMEDGYEVRMKREYLWVFNETGKSVTKVQRAKNRLYKVVLKIVKPVCLALKTDDEAWVGHARFGHVSFRVLDSMVKMGLVKGMPNIPYPTQICDGCLVAKKAREPFLSETQWRVSNPLELVHTDL